MTLLKVIADPLKQDRWARKGAKGRALSGGHDQEQSAKAGEHGAWSQIRNPHSEIRNPQLSLPFALSCSKLLAPCFFLLT